MHLPKPFYRLPHRFDVERLHREVAAFTEADWLAHPSGYAGNDALVLVSAGGTYNHDLSLRAPMRPTPLLVRSPYLLQVLAALDVPVSRTRLMRIGGGGEVPEHRDLNCHWLRRTRIHIPIVTDPAVRFRCDGEEIHMPAGEAWTFDNFRLHTVVNGSNRARIHLVVDTQGTPAFWDQLFAPTPAPPRPVPFIPNDTPEVRYEPYRFDVLTPEEAAPLVATLTRALPPDAGRLRRRLDLFERAWRVVFDEHGQHAAGEPAYARLIKRLQADLVGVPLAPAGQDALRLFDTMLWSAPVAPALDRPVFIVSAPRSGSSLLFETLAAAPDVWTPGGEGHHIVEGLPALHPAARGYASNRLTDDDATPDVAEQVRERYRATLRSRDGRRLNALPAFARPATVRLLEKTPKNALRVPFLRAVFPDARFIFLYRRPEGVLSSLLEGWASGRFVTYPDLPGWDGPPWSFLLPAGWQAYRDAAPEERAAFQWRATNALLLADLSQLPADAWTVVSYEALVADPDAVVRRLCAFAGFAVDDRLADRLAEPLPLARHTLTAPHPDKWRRHEAEVDRVRPSLAPVMAQLEQLGA